MDDSIIRCFFFLGPHHGSGVETWKLPSTMPHIISLHFTLQLSVQRVGVDWEFGTSVDDGAHTLCSSLKRTVRLHFCSDHPALFFSRQSLMADFLPRTAQLVFWHIRAPLPDFSPLRSLCLYLGDSARCLHLRDPPLMFADFCASVVVTHCFPPTVTMIFCMRKHTHAQRPVQRGIMLQPKIGWIPFPPGFIDTTRHSHRHTRTHA